MKNFKALIAWLLIATQAFAGITYHGTTGQTLYARVQTGTTTFKGVALTEGSSGGLGVYTVTDAALVSAGITSTDGDYAFTIRSGSASDTANDTIVGSGVLGWAGTVERPLRSNVTYLAGSATGATNMNTAYNTNWATLFDTVALCFNANLIKMQADDGTSVSNLANAYNGSGYAGGTIKQQVAVTKILSTTLTESSAGYLAAGFKKVFDVATPVFTAASVNQTADNNTILANATYGLSATMDQLRLRCPNKTYFVDEASGNNGNVGDYEAPFASFTTARSAARAGLDAVGYIGNAATAISISKDIDVFGLGTTLTVSNSTQGVLMGTSGASLHDITVVQNGTGQGVKITSAVADITLNRLTAQATGGGSALYAAGAIGLNGKNIALNFAAKTLELDAAVMFDIENLNITGTDSSTSGASVGVHAPEGSIGILRNVNCDLDRAGVTTGNTYAAIIGRGVKIINPNFDITGGASGSTGDAIAVAGSLDRLSNTQGTIDGGYLNSVNAGSGVAKQIDASVSGSNVVLLGGTQAILANCLGPNNVHFIDKNITDTKTAAVTDIPATLGTPVDSIAEDIASNGATTAAGGPIEQRPVVASRVLQVRDRGDGTFGVIGKIYMKKSERFMYALEFKGTQIAAGQNLYGMSQHTVAGANASHMTAGDYGVNDTRAKFEVTTTSSATSTDVITVEVTVQVTATETITISVPVTIGS